MKKVQSMLLTTTSSNCLSFYSISPEEVNVVVSIDADFAVNKHKSCQGGISAIMRDYLTGSVNLIHHACLKCKQVCKSVLTAELFALVHSFDIGSTITHALTKMKK